MNRIMMFVAAATIASTSVFGQNDAFSSANKTFYGMIKGNLVKAAEKMPEDNYSFQPTKEVRTFGQIVGHVADANLMFCSAAKGEQKQPSAEKTKTSKADLVAALKESIAYCDGVYGAMTDEAGAVKVKFFGNDLSKSALLEFNVAHNNEHYGNIVTYMRIKGLVPPSSESSR
jgi:uncharacterized damage-inducible protein DinB